MFLFLILIIMIIGVLFLLVKIDIGNKPELTDQKIMEILQKNLPYKIEMWQGLGSGISIWKNTLIGAIVKIKRRDDKTILSVEMNPPSLLIRLLVCIFSLFCGLLILFFISSGFAKNVAEDIKKIPEFQITN